MPPVHGSRRRGKTFSKRKRTDLIVWICPLSWVHGNVLRVHLGKGRTGQDGWIAADTTGFCFFGIFASLDVWGYSVHYFCLFFTVIFHMQHKRIAVQYSPSQHQVSAWYFYTTYSRWRQPGLMTGGGQEDFSISSFW